MAFEQPDGTVHLDEPERRLDSWKEIAKHLSRTVRTAQQWEKQESLPVHRHQHDRQGTVFAYRTELDRWLKDRADTSDVAKTAAGGRNRFRVATLSAAAAGAVVVLAVVGWLALGATGGDSRSARSLPFEERDRELIATFENRAGEETFDGVEGDLEKAARLYQQIAMSASASRNQVAQALLALGSTYERQGSPEAMVAFERVVSEFSDQPRAFLAAMAKLNAIAPDASSGGTARITGAEYRLVLNRLPLSDPHNGRLHDFSPDGSKLVIGAPPTNERKERFPDLLHELYVSHTSGFVGRALIEDAEDWEFISDPRWSPNGRYILYTVKRANEQRLMLLDLHAQQAQHLAGDSQVSPSWGGGAWMPDSSGFLVQTRDGFRIIGLEGEVKRHFVGRLSHTIRLGTVSADGRYLLYHKQAANKEDRSEMDLWWFDLETGEHIGVSNDPGFEGWPTWSKDGKHIYYVSGPEGARNVFRRTPGSDEPPVRVTSYSNASVTHPLVLPEGGQLTFVFMKDNHVILLADTSDVESPRTVVRGSKAMLSPDGKFIYYLNNEPDRVGLWRVSVEGDDPQQLVSGTVLTSYGPKTLLSPDGSRIAYAQHTGDSTSLFAMPSSGGPATELYTTGHIRNLIPAWSPDGKEIAFSIAEDMMVIPSDGGDPTILASEMGWDSWNLEWSPDGKSIAAFAWLPGEKGSNVLVVVDRATKRIRRVTPESEGKYKEILAWHPDGDRISYMYYNAQDSNGSRIVALETGQISDLVDTPDPMWDYIGTWGPDRRYYFKSVVRGPGDLWGLYSFDEGLNEYETLRQLTDRAVSLPSWSRDGKLMTWSEMEPVRQLWMMTDYE